MNNVVIVGGGVAAKGFLKAATTFYKDARFTMIRRNERGPVPCGIPYAFGTLDDPNKNQSPDKPFIEQGVNIIIDEVIEIDRDNKSIKLENKEYIKYDKLILATGSIPFVPSLENVDLDGIYTIEKDLDKVVELKDKINEAKNIVIVGGGFIGVELADEINKIGDKKITLVELAANCLNVAFESSFSERIESSLRKQNIEVLTNTAVKGFIGNKKVEKTVLNNGTEIDADLVFLAIGAKPNTKLAEECGIEVDPRAGILVDEYQRTSDKDILAIGDCASKRDLFTDGFSNIRLASVAAKEGRNAAFNLFKAERAIEPLGVTNLFSTAVENKYYAAAGMTKSQLIDNNFDVIEINISAPNRHPASLPDSQEIEGVFFFRKNDLRLMGAQVSGNQQVAELINAIGIAIQNSATAYELYGYNYGTHPLGTSSPNHYILHQAGREALKIVKL